MKLMKEPKQRRQAPPVLASAACILAVLSVATASLGTATMAKYAASANVMASARVAKFEVLEIDKPYSGTKAGGWSASRAVTITTLSTAVTFDLPLFDYAYSNKQRKQDLGGSLSTVRSANNDLVAAPGTGHVGGAQNNPNDINASAGNDWSQIYFQIKNNSEVAIRFKIEYDAENSILPAIDSAAGAVTSVAGDNAQAAMLKLPIILRPYRGGDADGFLVSNYSVNRNLYTNKAETALATLSGPDPVSGKSYTGFLKAGGWFELMPGEQTGVDCPNVGVIWSWVFANTGGYLSAAESGLEYTVGAGQGYAFDNNGTAGGNYGDRNSDTANGGAVWNGYSSATVLPFMPISGTDPDTGAAILATKVRANNIDRFDTLLGMAARDDTVAVKLAFRIVVEQLD